MHTPKLLFAISIVILFVMGYVYAAHFFIEEWRQLDPELREFFPIAGLSGIALFLIAIRNVKGANKHLLTSMEVLIAISIPSIAGLQFLMGTKTGQFLFAGGIAVFSVLWFVYFGMMKKGKTEEEKRDIKNAIPTISMIFVVLIIYSVLSFSLILTLQNIQEQYS